MYVMDRGRHPDDVIGVDRHGKVMPGVAEELGRERRIDLVIEHAGRDARQQRGIFGSEQADGDACRHRTGGHGLGEHRNASKRIRLVFLQQA